MFSCILGWIGCGTKNWTWSANIGTILGGGSFSSGSVRTNCRHSEPVFVNVYGAQESITITVRQIGLLYRPARLGSIPGLHKRFTNTVSALLFCINTFLQNQFHSSESIPFFRINFFLRNKFLSTESIPLFRISSFLQNQFLSTEYIPFFRINSFLQDQFLS